MNIPWLVSNVAKIDSDGFQLPLSVNVDNIRVEQYEARNNINTMPRSEMEL